MRPGLVQYTDVDDAMIAYQVTGSGPIDIVYMIGVGSNFDMWWDYGPFARVLERFASYGRLILFDRRGSGISDPLPSDRLPTWEHFTEDLQAVLDAVGSERAAIIACFDSGPISLAFAAASPQRVRALVLWNSYAKHNWAPDYEIGVPPEAEAAANAAIMDLWGTEDLARFLLTDASEAAVRWLARVLRHAATPASFVRQNAQLVSMDARPFLPLVQTPVLALNSSHALTPPATGRYVAEHVANGRFIEVPGTTQEIYSAPNHEEIEDLIEEFLTGSKPLLRADRVLASVLFTDIVASTETAVQLGDAKWKTLLEEHDRGAHDAIASWGGRIANHTGDGILATFDGPGRSIRCALQMQHELRRHGIRIRSGIHFGEIEQRADGNVGGIGVHVAARVLSQAVADEIVCTRTVKELCFGSGIEFEDRGTHVLKGIPDSWSLFAVAGASAV